jgi:hypothetical protein
MIVVNVKAGALLLAIAAIALRLDLTGRRRFLADRRFFVFGDSLRREHSDREHGGEELRNWTAGAVNRPCVNTSSR